MVWIYIIYYYGYGPQVCLSCKICYNFSENRYRRNHKKCEICYQITKFDCMLRMFVFTVKIKKYVPSNIKNKLLQGRVAVYFLKYHITDFSLFFEANSYNFMLRVAYRYSHFPYIPVQPSFIKFYQYNVFQVKGYKNHLNFKKEVDFLGCMGVPESELIWDKL